QPATVVQWQRAGFRAFWRWKSRGKPGRPKIPAKHIAFIKQMSRENPGWGQDRIAEELRIKFGIYHSPATVAKYMVLPTRPRGLSWRNFLKAHGREILCCDFLVQYTTAFRAVYVLVILEIESRRIVHFNATTNPRFEWIKRQIVEAAQNSPQARFFIHDNDALYGRYPDDPRYRSNLDEWLSEVMGLKGIPTPYGAPKANAHLERFMRTLRREALDHFIFLSEHHVYRVTKEFIEFYNRARPHQGTAAIPNPYPELRIKPPPDGRLVAKPVLGGLQHDYRLAA
ncbi:MAG: integrase core domain-containing protein, partial [Bdellovibrionota bacterium]